MATATSDRQCDPVTPCTENSFETRGATPTSNRQCMPLKKCELPDKIEVAPPTKANGMFVSDRKCKDVTQCTIFRQYELVAPTTESDRVCANFQAPCQAQNSSWYESVAPTEFTDRACAPLTMCNLTDNTEYVKLKQNIPRVFYYCPYCLNMCSSTWPQRTESHRVWQHTTATCELKCTGNTGLTQWLIFNSIYFLRFLSNLPGTKLRARR